MSEKEQEELMRVLETPESGEGHEVGKEEAPKLEAASGGSRNVSGQITEEQARLMLAEEARKTREGLKTQQKGKKMVIAVVIIGAMICVAAVIFGIVMGERGERQGTDNTHVYK